MTLQDLGYNNVLKKYRDENDLNGFGIARVVIEHKDRYVVKNDLQEYEAELLGNLRFTAQNKRELPVVGDWVAISEYDENKAIIHHIYPRNSILERKAVDKIGQAQIIATNIDYGLIVQSVNKDFNINRLERYLSVCNVSKIAPIIVLSKIDLITAPQLSVLFNKIKERIKNVSIVPISNQSQIGIEVIKSQMIRGKTYCLLGSSGVGKSTLANSLKGEKLMNTREISKGSDKGKHVTTHRELIVLDYGVLIDNPGMREIGLTDASNGLEITFDEIVELSMSCKFNDCSHTNEKGCAILEAIENEHIDLDAYANFKKMEKERVFFEATLQEKKKKNKNLGKLIRNTQKARRNNKY